MEKYLLFIKSIINQGAYFKGSAIIDFYLRRFSNKYYYLVFLFSLILAHLDLFLYYFDALPFVYNTSLLFIID